MSLQNFFNNATTGQRVVLAIGTIVITFLLVAGTAAPEVALMGVILVPVFVLVFLELGRRKI